METFNIPDVLSLDDQHDGVGAVGIGIVGEDGSAGSRFIQVRVGSCLHGDQGNPKECHDKDGNRHSRDCPGMMIDPMCQPGIGIEHQAALPDSIFSGLSSCFVER